MIRKSIAFLLPLIGFLFVAAYIRNATVNVIYTDYTRLVNTYLTDVFSFRPYMGADILTRIPLNYVQRIVNVVFFSYSTTFDMILGGAGLFFMGLITARYIVIKGLPLRILFLSMIFLFSLNKWEMMTNGSGWIHFFAFACFFFHYYLLDAVASGRSKRERLLLLVPVFTILLVAGPYSGVYALTVFLAYLLLLLKKGPGDLPHLHRQLLRLVSVCLPLFLYMLSRHYSVEEHAGATTEGLGTVFQKNPLLFLQLFIKSFASMMLGAEDMERLGLTEGMIYLMGVLVLLAYGCAFWMQFSNRLYEKHLFPFLLLLSGFLNHVLITLSRWIFLRSDYAMSSRYALQYHVGILGILLTAGLCRLSRRKEKKRGPGLAIAFVLALCVAGNLYTTASELDKAKYRQENFRRMAAAALDYKNRTDAELKEIFQYHSGAKTREALAILEAQRLNVFSGER